LNQYERAIQDFDEAIKLKPNDAYSFSSRGDAYGHLKRHTEAVSDYDKAIALKRDFASAYTKRAIANFEM
jgi:tetratricopeptide (TPR) repeat protein